LRQPARNLRAFIKIFKFMWYNDNWGYRIKITVQNGKVDDDLSDFPCYVNLDDLPDAFFTHVKNGGGDIRITKADGETELAREVVSCDTGTKTGEVHFLADALSKDDDTDFYIYYGNDDADDYAVGATYGRNAVWADYAFVSHDGGITDSAGNLSPANHDTVNEAAGKIGNCRSFNGSDQYIDLGTDTVVFGSNPSVWSASLWFKPDSITGSHNLLSAYDSASGADQNHAINMLTSANDFRWEVKQNNTATEFQYEPPVVIDEWHKIGFTMNKNGLLKGYGNGALRNSDDAPTTGDYTDGGQVRLGVFKYNNNLAYFYDGDIDEVRIITGVEWTAEFISTEYNNQSDTGTFYDIGAEEPLPSAFIPQAIIF